MVVLNLYGWWEHNQTISESDIICILQTELIELENNKKCEIITLVVIFIKLQITSINLKAIFYVEIN